MASVGTASTTTIASNTEDDDFDLAKLIDETAASLHATALAVKSADSKPMVRPKKVGLFGRRKNKTGTKTTENNTETATAATTNHRRRDTVLLDEMPATLDAIIRYMDVLEPTKHYFEKHADSRNSCSQTRRKLQDFARAQPRHLAVAHWSLTGVWQPPNVQVLHAMIEILKEMISPVS